MLKLESPLWKNQVAMKKEKRGGGRAERKGRRGRGGRGGKGPDLDVIGKDLREIYPGDRP